MKHRGVLHCLKRRHHCPACNSNFDNSSLKDTGSKHFPGTNISQLSKSLPFPSSRKRTKLRKTSAATNTTANSSSCESTEIQNLEHPLDPNINEVDGKEDGNKMSNLDYLCMEESIDPCPFALTYETEDVESYQLSHDNDEVESYQMGWLLFNGL